MLPSPQVGAGLQTWIAALWPLPLRLPRWPPAGAISKKIEAVGDEGGLGRRSWDWGKNWLPLARRNDRSVQVSFFSTLGFGLGYFTDKRTVVNTCVRHQGRAVWVHRGSLNRPIIFEVHRCFETLWLRILSSRRSSRLFHELRRLSG